ncbi:transcription termination/antitermination protein NusG [Candidatus Poriferisocius sp.]|uniref:transcription termination/antitermination protein NusG n=1 Tax=Candidatus Poriferisocius sp. TaxID=3101276 RepID=UPI003B0116CC
MNSEVDGSEMTDLFPASAAPEATEPDAAQAVDAGEAVDAAEAAAALLPTGPVAQPAPRTSDQPEELALPGDAAAADDADTLIDADELVYEKAEEETETVSPYDMPGKWYVVHTQSGYENKVQQNIEARRKTMDTAGHIHDTVIPMEDVVEFKGGKKVTAKKKMFPGYLLVRAEINDVSWDVIRNTPGVTGFVGHGQRGSKPTALKRKDVENFLQVKTDGEQTVRRTKPRLLYEVGETIRVKEGPFADFSGEVAEINEDQLKVKVLVNIFGRETPVELEFSQVAKL